MVAVEEKNIRTNLSSRTSVLLKSFRFARQEDIILFLLLPKPLGNYTKETAVDEV
jgi:hypothetical protein